MVVNILSLDQSEKVHDLDEILDSAKSQPPSNQLHGHTPPAREVLKEKGHHRTAAYMYASGAKIKTIAFELSVTEPTVSTWVKQPWFQQTVAQIIHNEFNDDISRMLKAGAIESIMVVRDIASNGVSETNKLNAAKDLLDRYRGKATNFTVHTGGALTESPEVEMLRLEKELKLTDKPQ